MIYRYAIKKEPVSPKTAKKIVIIDTIAVFLINLAIALVVNNNGASVSTAAYFLWAFVSYKVLTKGYLEPADQNKHSETAAETTGLKPQNQPEELLKNLIAVKQGSEVNLNDQNEKNTLNDNLVVKADRKVDLGDNNQSEDPQVTTDEQNINATTEKTEKLDEGHDKTEAYVPLVFKDKIVVKKTTEETNYVPIVFDGKINLNSPTQKPEFPVHNNNQTRGVNIGLTNILFCRRCGKELPTDSEFCQYCGTKIIKE